MNKVNKAVFDTNAQCCDIMNDLIKEQTMEKINILELLKDCPQGMELDCYLFNGLEFDHIDTDNEDYPIICRVKSSSGEYYKHTFTKYGWYTAFFDYSKCVIFPKGKTTWEGFVPPCKFKVGDKITNGKTSITIGYIDNEYYYETGRSIATRLLIKNQDKWELVPNKFDIATLVPFESRVLIRDNVKEKWHPGIWGYYDNNTDLAYPYKLIGCIARYCIPYEGNEHLLGKTNDCDEYFKTWK